MRTRPRSAALGAFVLTSLLAGPVAAQSACDRKAFRIALDIGHDRSHPGATSARGATEFSYNLSLSELVLHALQENGFISTFRIGETGAPISLNSRPAQAKAGHADVFVSLHHDSAQQQYFSTWTYNGRMLPFSDEFHGFSIFVSTSSSLSKANLTLATDLGRALRAQGLTPSLHHAALVEGEGRTLLNADLGIYRFDQLAVLRGASMPALLLESGVIVNRDEEQAIRTGGYHPKIASALVRALTEFCAQSGPTPSRR